MSEPHDQLIARLRDPDEQNAFLVRRQAADALAEADRQLAELREHMKVLVDDAKRWRTLCTAAESRLADATAALEKLSPKVAALLAATPHDTDCRVFRGGEPTPTCLSCSTLAALNAALAALSAGGTGENEKIKPRRCYCGGPEEQVYGHECGTGRYCRPGVPKPWEKRDDMEEEHDARGD